MSAIYENLVVQEKLRHSTKKLPLKTQQKIYMLGIILVDIIMLAAAFVIAYIIRFKAGIPIFYENYLERINFYIFLSATLIPIWLVLFWLYRLYDEDILLGGLQEYTQLFNASISGAVVIAVVQFFSEELIVARGWVGLAWIFTFILSLIGRFLMRRLGYSLRRKGYLNRATIIVGVNGEGKLLGEQLERWPTSGLNVIGYLDDHNPVGARICGSLMVLDKVDCLDLYIKDLGIEEVVITTSAISRDEVFEIFKKYGASPDIQIRMSSGLFDLLTTGLHVKEMGYVPLISVNRVRLNEVETLFKRLTDIGLSLVAIIVGIPIFIITAVMIKLSSPGPIFHRRRVMGLNASQFDAFKFRTMYINGDEILNKHPEARTELETTHKIKSDPRITKLGNFLRKTSLDEYPQFINILLGQMSFVGPRMITSDELMQYGDWGMNLLTVRPGLTGLWQVSGRSDVNYDERVRLDMMYIRNYSLWLDLQIILRTIPVVMSGRGAY